MLKIELDTMYLEYFAVSCPLYLFMTGLSLSGTKNKTKTKLKIEHNYTVACSICSLQLNVTRHTAELFCFSSGQSKCKRDVD